MKKTALVLLVCLVFAASAFGAGSSLTGTYTFRGTDMLVIAITATADDATGAYPSSELSLITGLDSIAEYIQHASYGGWYLMGFETNPGATGPTDDALDIALTDADGFDILQGAGANRDNSDTEYVELNPVFPIKGTLTLTPTNNLVNSAVCVITLILVR